MKILLTSETIFLLLIFKLINLKIMQLLKKIILFGSLLFTSKENRCNFERLGDSKFDFLLTRHEKTQNKNKNKSSTLKSIPIFKKYIYTYTPIFKLCNLPVSLIKLNSTLLMQNIECENEKQIFHKT